jgi:hypothetical protein
LLQGIEKEGSEAAFAVPLGESVDAMHLQPEKQLLLESGSSMEPLLSDALPARNSISPEDKNGDLGGSLALLEEGEISTCSADGDRGQILGNDRTDEDSFFDSLDAADPEGEAGEFVIGSKEDYFTVSLSSSVGAEGCRVAGDGIGEGDEVVSTQRGAGAGTQSSGAGTQTEVQHVVGSDAATLAKLKVFCHNVIKTLAPPLLKEVESTRRRCQEDDLATPRRVTRSSVSMHSGKPLKRASAAESVLLKALGFTPNDLDVSEQALQDFKELFDAPLQDQHIRVIAAIFGKLVPQDVVEVSQTPGAISAH